MGEVLITVAIINYNSSAFIETSLSALAKLTANDYRVVICDNGSKITDRKRLERVVSRYKNVDLFYRQQSASGSMGHGEALNVTLARIKTPYGLILDSDAIILAKNWDRIFINQLNEKIKVIGASALPGNQIKPTDFPIVAIVFFDFNLFSSLGIDMRPLNPLVGKDTGWEMREKFLGAGYAANMMEVRNTRRYKDGPFREVICEEFYLEGYRDIFACHFGRGSTLGEAKYKNLKLLLRLPGVITLAKRIIGSKEKRKWLAVSRDIINSQSGT